MKISGEDIFVWADGSWCYRYEIHEYGHKSDDYEVLWYNTKEHLIFSMANC